VPLQIELGEELNDQILSLLESRRHG
jgi:hypothetical protein